MKRAELEDTFSSVPVLTTLDSKQQSEVEDLLKHPGLRHVYGLMLGSRQAQYVLLAHSPLGNAGDVSRAARIQGTILGIEFFRDTLLEQTVPDGNSTEEQNRG